MWDKYKREKCVTDNKGEGVGILKNALASEMGMQNLVHPAGFDLALIQYFFILVLFFPFVSFYVGSMLSVF